MDSFPRVFPNFYSGTGHSVEGCYQKAIELGYEMFAIQNGGECWLDDSQKNDYDRYGPTDKCVGDVGGKWVSSVYRVKSKFVYLLVFWVRGHGMGGAGAPLQ